MKKIRDILISIILSLVFAFIAFNFFQSYSNEKEEKLIKEDLPSAEEISDFQVLLNDNTYYYYNQLNDSDKEIYLTLYSSFMRFDDAVTTPAEESSLKDLFKAVLYDNPHIFWVEHDFEYVLNDNSVKFIPHYRYNETESKAINSQLESIINRIVDIADDYETDFEKELFVHDYICENTAYDETIDGNTICDVLINGKAVCEGYAKTVQILLDKLDIDNYLIVGDSEFEGELGPHMWNVVTIDNHNYHLDATWNDNDKENDINYFYFNISDDGIKEDHFNLSPADNFCVSDKANYFVQNESYFEEFSSFNDHIERSAELLYRGENTVEFLFDETDDFNKAVKHIENDTDFFKYIIESIKRSGRKIDTSEITYITIAEHNYLCVVFKEG
ncbi:MAG: hypothetical protein IJA80_08555 [Clostridia bacterium]|nr:hypothetical protein [Clostridia bacterium]